ncbi:MAG: sulfotransferase family protein [Xanthomonadales bacterium]|nr:sulfotransferase family protein [Xanthomonadales bacterium]
MPRPAVWVRAINVGAGLARRLGIKLASLEADEIRQQAIARAGFDDLGPDDGWRDGLGKLTEDYRRHARLTPIGRIAAHRHLVDLLANRLRMERDRAEHPEIESQPVPAPLFIVGLPRTGTTLLHMLLAQDPANRVPETWEVMHPAPIEGTEDKRIRRAARELAWMERLAPGFRVMHPLAPRLPQECIAIDSHTLQGYEFQTTHDVPGYQRWFEQRDKHAVYRHHKRFLQYLQWQRPRLHKAHWVLKAPAHLFGLAELLAVYPDAGIVQTHRNPLKVMASLASLSTMLRAAFSESVDPRAVGREMARRWGGGLLGALEQRDSGRLPAERFLDIDYRAIVEDPIDTVKTIYARFDRELTPTAERAMRAFLAANPKDKHGAHRYSLEQFGLDADEQDRRFAAYRARFGC